MPTLSTLHPSLAGDLKLSIADDSAIGLSALLITSPITIQGNAAGITIKRDITAPEMRFFRVALGGDLTLDSLNVTGGITRGTNGASGQNGGTAFAGAIYNQGNLQIVASTLYNNAAIGGNAGAGGNSGSAQGGAVFNDGGNVTIRNSTLSGNSVSNGTGPRGRSQLRRQRLQQKRIADHRQQHDNRTAAPPPAANFTSSASAPDKRPRPNIHSSIIAQSRCASRRIRS